MGIAGSSRLPMLAGLHIRADGRRRTSPLGGRGRREAAGEWGAAEGGWQQATRYGFTRSAGWSHLRGGAT